MPRALPAALRRRSDIEAIAEDIAPYRGTTVEQRAEVMSSLCRFAAEQVAARADGWRIRAFQEPRSPASVEAWRTLVDRARERR